MSSGNTQSFSGGSDPNVVAAVLQYVHAVGNTLVSMGARIGDERLHDVLGALYGIMVQAEHAIVLVLQDMDDSKPVAVPLPAAPAMLDEPSDPSQLPDFLEDVWDALQPWTEQLMAELPRGSSAEMALEEWAARFLAEWQPLTANLRNRIEA